MTDENTDDDFEEDPHEWEYYQQAEQEYLREQARQRFHNMPIICQKCRWLDWYYLEECTYGLYPINGKCPKHCRDYGFVHKLPSKLRLLFWDIQYRLWNWLQKRRAAEPPKERSDE